MVAQLGRVPVTGIGGRRFKSYSSFPLFFEKEINMGKENVLLVFNFSEEPNEHKMTAIKFDGNEMEFRSFHGFEVQDIYELLFGKEINNES